MVTVQPATLRDTTYVMAYLRPADVEEVMCQVPPGTSTNGMAYSLLMSGDTFSARIGDQPIAIFGTGPLNAACLSVWALGTRRMHRAVPAINRFMLDVHLPDMVERGYRSMEARSHVSHASAHRWLRAMGGQQHGPAFSFGRGREMFLLFRWTDDDLFRIRKAKERKHENKSRILAGLQGQEP